MAQPAIGGNVNPTIDLLKLLDSTKPANAAPSQRESLDRTTFPDIFADYAGLPDFARRLRGEPGAVAGPSPGGNANPVQPFIPGAAGSAGREEDQGWGTSGDEEPDLGGFGLSSYTEDDWDAEGPGLSETTDNEKFGSTVKDMLGTLASLHSVAMPTNPISFGMGLAKLGKQLPNLTTFLDASGVAEPGRERSGYGFVDSVSAPDSRSMSFESIEDMMDHMSDFGPGFGPPGGASKDSQTGVTGPGSPAGGASEGAGGHEAGSLGPGGAQTSPDDLGGFDDIGNDAPSASQEAIDELGIGGGEGSDSDSGECYISTALNDTGVWSDSEKRLAVNWCRRTHHDGSVRGALWVDGYHRWGRLVAKLSRHWPAFRRFTRYLSNAFVGQATGKNPTVLGFLVKWLWAQPLSYGIGMAVYLKSRFKDRQHGRNRT